MLDLLPFLCLSLVVVFAWAFSRKRSDIPFIGGHFTIVYGPGSRSSYSGTVTDLTDRYLLMRLDDGQFRRFTLRHILRCKLCRR